MTLAEAIAIVRRHNAWRRGDSSEMLPPTVIGQALDALCDHAERMEREATAAKFASTTAKADAT
jgi:hypothetical protein